MPAPARALSRMLVAGSLLFGGIGAAHAAGALAVGACGAYGYAYDFGNVATARATALRKCSGPCKAVIMRRACAAFAIAGSKPCGAHGYASAMRLGQAQNTALRQCYKHGGRDCVIRAWACDGKG